MTDLIKFNSQLDLSHQLIEDPFGYLFLSHLPPSLPLSAKTRYIKELAIALTKLESHTENALARNHWLCITSGFSAAITVASSMALVPVAGMILSGAAVVAATGTIIDAVANKSKVESIAQTLKRHRLALSSQESQQWAALWEYAEVDLFLRALDYASEGFIVGDKLVQRGDNSPFMRAVDFIAECRGMQYVEVIEAARAIISKPAVSNKGEKPMLLPAPSTDHSQRRSPLVSSRTPPHTAPTTQHLPLFDRNRVINESKGLMIVGDMGAAKTCVAQYIANGFDGYGIIILDPHGMTDWGNAYVITKMGAIYEQMRILLDLLENGDTTPLLIICDEWLEIRGDRRNKKGSEYAGLADDFIRLFSTKPRKFNKLAAFVLHSPNVEAAGVDSFLRENYLKVYLGRVAKKEFSQIQDCAYPCVLEDEQQEHPTHGHHTEFKPHGKAPRNLQPLSSAPINIPLAYMKGSEVEVCARGWDGQLRLDVANIRNQLEMLYRDTGNDTSIDTDTSYQEEEILGDTDDTGTDTSDTGNDTDDTANAGNPCQSSSISDTSGDTDDTKPDIGVDTKRYTPTQLTKDQVSALIRYLKSKGMTQTQIIEDVWQCEKNKVGWKGAYVEYKELMGE